MPTVVGTDDSAKKRITCRSCASIVEYVPKDVETLWQGTDYSGGPDGAKGFKCPHCGRNVIVERW